MKLNLGCGPIRFADWLNVDFKDRDDVDKSHLFMKLDLTGDFPWSEGSIEHIYCGHFISQLTAEQGIEFINKCHKILMPNGILRIADNDVMFILKPYFIDKGNGIEFNPACMGIRRCLESDKRRGVVLLTPMHQLWYDIHRYGWKFLYDYDTLAQFCLKAGFRDTKKTKSGESSTPSLIGLELKRHGEIVIEATK